MTDREPSETHPELNAAEFRRQAALCFELAERMPLSTDRDKMFLMAQRWIALARKEEGKPD